RCRCDGGRRNGGVPTWVLVTFSDAACGVFAILSNESTPQAASLNLFDSRDQDGWRDIPTSYPTARIDAALQVARMRLIAETPIPRVFAGDHFQLGFGEVGFTGRFRGFLDLVLVKQRAGDACQRRVHQEPLASKLVDGHAVRIRDGTHDFEFLETV